MKVIIQQRLALPERSGTILVRGSEIWTFGDKTKKLQRYTGLQDRKLKQVAPLPAISAKNAALSWNGTSLLAGDRSQRKVFRVDSDSGKETLVMDPKTLDFGDYDRALLSEDAVVGDIAWHEGILFVAVQSGYSSAIYGIDLAKNKVVSHRHAPGPKPSGLDIDPSDGSLYTVDNRNRELRRFSVSGKVDVAELPAEWVEPRGLSFEPDGGLWSSDWFTGDVLRIKVEG